MAKIENIALFDMDGTLCDYDKGLITELEKLRSDYEPPIKNAYGKNTPDYIKKRRRLITSLEEWWVNLPKFQLGFDVLNIARELDYRIMILTQGPRDKPFAWSGKKKWIDKHLGKEVDITITRNKSLVYGKILVDDYPGHVESWLKHRPRGLVIMPVGNQNKDYQHKQVIKYDGSNLEEVKIAMSNAKLR